MPDVLRARLKDILFPNGMPTGLADETATEVTVLGDRRLLDGRKLAFFCSRKCPPPLIVRLFDLAVWLRERRVTVVSGFHSPIEQDILDILLRGSQPVIICPARGLETMRVPSKWKRPIDEGRLLVISRFGPDEKRMSRRRAILRNRFAAALADEVLVIADAAGDGAWALAEEVRQWGKPLLAVESDGDGTAHPSHEFEENGRAGILRSIDEFLFSGST